MPEDEPLPPVKMESCSHQRTRSMTVGHDSPEWDFTVRRGGMICLDCGVSLRLTIEQANEMMVRRQIEHYHNTRERAEPNAERAIKIMDQTKLDWCAMLPETGTPYPIPETCQVEGCETKFSQGHGPAAPMTKVMNTTPHTIIFGILSGLPRVSLVCRLHSDLMRASRFTGNMKGAYALDNYDYQWFKEHEGLSI